MDEMKPTRTKFKQEIRQQLLSDLRDGVPRRVAVKRAGISYSTFKSWLRSARLGSEVYVQFAEEVRTAEADAIARCVKAIVRASRPRKVTTTKSITFSDGTTKVETTVTTKFEWQAAVWWLERMHPEEFSNEAKEIRELQRQVNEIRKKCGMGDLSES